MLIYGKVKSSNNLELFAVEREKIPEIITGKIEISM
jgi:hypothetical protein